MGYLFQHLIIIRLLLWSIGKPNFKDQLLGIFEDVFFLTIYYLGTFFPWSSQARCWSTTYQLTYITLISIQLLCFLYWVQRPAHCKPQVLWKLPLFLFGKVLLMVMFIVPNYSPKLSIIPLTIPDYCLHDQASNIKE